jgi:hydroxyacylglutathione hydrolase
VALASSSFATRAGFVLDPSRPVAIQAASAREAEQAARGLRSVGFLELAGYLLDGDLTGRLEPVSLDELDRLLGAEAVELVDVREKDEHDEAYIPGSTHVPFRRVAACASELGNGKPIVTICATGARASIAASILTAAGKEARPVLGSGVAEWQASGRPTAKFRRCGS